MNALEGRAAFVLGTGPDLPANRLAAFRPWFAVGVNALWKHTDGFRPTVGFWIDGGVYEANPEWFDSTLCVCDRSAIPKGIRSVIALPGSGGPMPTELCELNPSRLYLAPNTGIVAALWAASLGCDPVVLLGMGAEDDGRRTEQQEAMRAALRTATEPHRFVGQHGHSVLWLWPRCVVENPYMFATYMHVLNPCPSADARGWLRSFYDL